MNNPGRIKSTGLWLLGQSLGKQVQQTDVLLEHPLDTRLSDLDGNPMTVESHPLVDLGDGCTGHRLFIDLAKAVGQITAQRTLDHLTHLAEGNGIDIISQSLHLADQRRRKDVRATGDQLSQFDVERAEVL